MSLTSILQNLSPRQSHVRIESSVIVEMPIGAIWPLLSNTQRLNPSIGLPPVFFQQQPEELALSARTRFLGLPFAWRELPFEWVEEQEFLVERQFRGPIARAVVAGARFEPLEDERTRVKVIGEVQPNSYLGRLLGALVLGTWTVWQYRRLLRTFERNYLAGQRILFPPPTAPRVDESALASYVETLRATPRASEVVAARLSELLRQAADEEVTRMRPYALADRWELPRDEVLRTFLYATRVGLLNLQWEILCPNCRVSKASYSTLAELRKQAHCETCHINFDANFDQYVELRFTANRRVRSTHGETFCVGGPFVTPHIKVQARIPARSSKRVALPLAVGQYRLRCRGLLAYGNLALTEEPPPEGAASLLLLDENGPVAGTALQMAAGSATTLIVQNQSDAEAVLIVEQAVWDQGGVSAAAVTALQDFRDLFSSELLAPGLGIAVRTVTLLFSDLKDSTVLYEKEGDSSAYAQVRDHFVALNGAIRDHNGAVVKTIGDAVMAIFTEPADALRAAIQSQEAVAGLNADYRQRPPLRLKLGLHSGPCIAITANNVLDYFGSTVNAAARAQGLSQGGDIVLTEATARDPSVRAILQHFPVIEQFDATLKGLTPTFHLHRLWPRPDLWGPDEAPDPSALAPEATLVGERANDGGHDAGAAH